MRNMVPLVALIAVVVVACGTETVDPSITFDGETCSSTDPSRWPSGALDISVANNTTVRSAVVIGTYQDGYDREDLLAYGSDVTTRPDFINAVEIFAVDPESSRVLAFDPGPDRYFMVCMPDTNTMVVLDDLIIAP